MTTYTEQIKELCEANSIEYFIHGYYILSTDEIIRNNLIKDPNDTLHFSFIH